MNTENICKALNAYMFQNVWNEPYKNDRRSIKPNLLISGSRTGSFTVSSHTITLPNLNEPYYIYYVKQVYLDYRDFGLKRDKWKSVEEINNSKYFFTFVNQGKSLYRGKIFFQYYQPSGDLFIAISKKMMNAIVGPECNKEDTRAVLYFDWDLEDSISFKSYIVTTSSRSTILTAMSKPDVTSIFLNGEKIYYSSNLSIKVDDYVEIVKDQNVKIDFNIDLTTDEGKRVYLNTTNQKLYTICHIPKDLNPLNKLYTYNVAEIYVYPKNPMGSKASGLFLFSSSLKYIQITHNDFGIPEELLVAYGKFLGTEEIVLNVQVRNNSNTNILVRDQNYIDLLYRHTDNEILNFLEGQGSTILNFWMADHLVKSNYLKYMMSTPVPVDVNNVKTYVDTFGYQYVLSILTDNIRKFVYNEETIKYPFIVKKPEIYTGLKVNALLFINGYKIDSNKVLVKHLNADYILVQLVDDDLIPEDGDEIIIEILDQFKSGVLYVNPTLNNNTTILSHGDYNVFRVRDIPGPPINGLENNYFKYYTEVAPTDYLISKGLVNYTLSFIYSATNAEYVIIPSNGSYLFRKDITDIITNKDPIQFNLEFLVNNSSMTIPVLNVSSTKVFLNGHSLVEGLDYKLIKYKYSNEIVGTQIVVYNRLAVKETGENILEVLVSTNQVEKNYKFFNSDTENFIENSYTWFDSIGTVSIDGKQVIKAYNTNRGILIDAPHRSGGLVESTCMYPKQTRDFVEAFKSQEADTRHSILVSYFNSKIKVYDGLITIPYPHELYSIKVATIVRDLITQQLSLVYDPSPNKMIDMLDGYSYLDALDIINDDIDKRFIDFYPSHTDVTVADEYIYRLVDYISRILIKDPLTYGGIG